MISLISYSFHLLGSTLFFLLIPLPYLIKGTVVDKKQFSLLLRIYKRIVWFSHGALVVALVSGFFLVTKWISFWLFAIILIWAVIGMALGMTAKLIREILSRMEKGLEKEEEIKKLKKYSLLLTFVVIAMFAMKIVKYF